MARHGLAAAVRYDPGADADLQHTPFLDEWLLPVASPAWVAAHPQLKAPGDLRPEDLLHDDQAWAGAGPHEEWQQWLAAALPAGVPPALTDGLAGGRHFNLCQLSLAAAQAGQGVAMGRAALVADDLAAGHLVALFPATAAGPALRSRAAYRLVAPADAAPGVGEVLAWLTAQAAAFRQHRDAVLGLAAPGA